MRVDLRCFAAGALLFFCKGPVAAEALPELSYQFSTAKYSIEMRVCFPAPYEGKRLVVYRSNDASQVVCLPSVAGTSGCIERFVGALALVAFTVKRVADGKPALVSIREVVTQADQSPGMPERPPFNMSIRLVDGIGSDVQAFGYDESPLPADQRAVEREAAKAAWRRYRQELYMNKDGQPFAVVEWLHTTTGVSIVRVDGR